MVNDAPRFDADDAARIARNLYGLDAIAERLASERDQNFLLTTLSGEQRVLKIANAREERVMLEAQQAAMAHVATRFAACPRPIPLANGEAIGAVKGVERTNSSIVLATKFDR